MGTDRGIENPFTIGGAWSRIYAGDLFWMNRNDGKW